MPSRRPISTSFKKGHTLSMRKGDPRLLTCKKRGPDRKPRKKNARYGWAVNRKDPVATHRHKPEGTIDEMTLAYNQARGYQLVLLDYCDKEELPPEILKHQRRLFHFAKNGPNANKFMAYGSSKLLYADVLYILSCKVPARRLAEVFNVGIDTISDIRRGRAGEWREEYLLVRRLRMSATSRVKKNYKAPRITVLLDTDGGIVQHFSSIRKAKEFRRSWLIYNQKIPAKEVDLWIKGGKIDEMYPIQETSVIT